VCLDRITRLSGLTGGVLDWEGKAYDWALSGAAGGVTSRWAGETPGARSRKARYLARGGDGVKRVGGEKCGGVARGAVVG